MVCLTLICLAAILSSIFRVARSSSLAAMVRISLLLLLISSVASASAQQAPPPEVHLGDVIQRYVPIGTIVSVRGHLAYVSGRAIMVPNMPSAMVPAIVDVTNLPPSDHERLQTACEAKSTTSGGCSVKIEGQIVEIDARPGLLATRIEFL